MEVKNPLAEVTSTSLPSVWYRSQLGNDNDHAKARTLVDVNEPAVDSRRCTGGGLFEGRGGELPSSVVGFVEAFLAGGGGGFEGPVEVGKPPNLGVDINEAAAAATRPGPL